MERQGPWSSEMKTIGLKKWATAIKQKELHPNWNFKRSNRSCSISHRNTGNPLMALAMAFCSAIFLTWFLSSTIEQGWYLFILTGYKCDHFFPVGHTVKEPYNLRQRALLTIKISNNEEIKFQTILLFYEYWVERFPLPKWRSPHNFLLDLRLFVSKYISFLRSFKNHEIFPLLAAKVGIRL